jgi:hypothetical protein
LAAGGVPSGGGGSSWRSVANLPVGLHRLGVGSVANEQKGTGSGFVVQVKVCVHLSVVKLGADQQTEVEVRAEVNTRVVSQCAKV